MFEMMDYVDTNGWLSAARQIPSPNCDERPAGCQVELLIVHNISLPPFEYGSDAVERFFTNSLDSADSPFFRHISALKVSAHFLIRRNGALIQFVSIDKRAWHAGLSAWHGRSNCNDFSIGVELEGCDYEAFTEAQYQTLQNLCQELMQTLPLTTVTGHSNVAPGRKTDPGFFFDWGRLRNDLSLCVESVINTG